MYFMTRSLSLTTITINFNIEEVFQISVKKWAPITGFNLFVLKYYAGKTEYFIHYWLTGRLSQVTDN